ncbi:MAG: tyrosine/phenylalanine carboxypeptidase domain-containing protein [Myxococcota bacterium]
MNWRNVRHSFSETPDRRLQAELDVLLRRLHERARALIGATTHSDPRERQRLVHAVERGQHAKPQWRWKAVPIDSTAWRDLDRARLLAERSVAPSLYLGRLEELETELLLLESLGQPKRVRPMAARLFGTGSETVFDDSKVRVLDAAHDLLAGTAPDDEPRVVPADCAEGPSLAALMLSHAREVGIHIAVRVDARLIANAAVGERTVFIADRLFGEREAKRLAAHEVYGHLVSGFNGRTQRLGVLAIGTARSHGDQEGVAIFLEELGGFLDGSRRRTLAGRLLATHAMHAGVAFGDTTRVLHSDHGFSPAESVTLCERAFRGGGVARDAVYLTSWLRVRRAVLEGHVSLAELQLGKVSLGSVADLRRLRRDGFVGQPRYLSNLACSLGKTGPGTKSATSPPSLATSFTRFDAT